MCGQVVTKCTLLGWSLAKDDRCPCCAAERDTVEHRLFGRCGSSEVQALRTQVKLRHWLDRADDDEEEWGRARGLFPQQDIPPDEDGAAADRWAVLGSAVHSEVTEGGFFRACDGPIGLDGSCMDGRTDWARVAGAAVQTDGSGAVTRGIAFRVPHDWRQSAAAAEQLAAYYGDRYAEEGCVLVTDCPAVAFYYGQRDFMGDLSRPVWSGLWRQHKRRTTGITKVKAHRSREAAEAEGGGSLRLWHLNDAADVAAKSRAAAGLPPRQALENLQRVHHARRQFLFGVGKLLRQWPTGQELAQPSRGLQVRLDSIEVFAGHNLFFSTHRKRWVCATCGVSCGEKRRQRLSQRVCRQAEVGSSYRAQSIQDGRALGHDPRGLEVEAGGWAMGCWRCGAFSEAKQGGFRGSCPGTPQSGGAAFRLARMKDGKHPRRVNVALTPVRRERPE